MNQLVEQMSKLYLPFPGVDVPPLACSWDLLERGILVN